MATTSRETDWTTWMRAAMAGDVAAYRKFLHAVALYIRAVARSRCRRLGVLDIEAEDIVQEVLLTIHLKQGTWDQSREIGPWVSTITRNKVIDAFRRRGRRIDVPLEDVIDILQADDQRPDILPRDIDFLLMKLPQRLGDAQRRNGSHIVINRMPRCPLIFVHRHDDAD